MYRCENITSNQTSSFFHCFIPSFCQHLIYPIYFREGDKQTSKVHKKSYINKQINNKLVESSLSLGNSLNSLNSPKMGSLG